MRRRTFGVLVGALLALTSLLSGCNEAESVRPDPEPEIPTDSLAVTLVLSGLDRPVFAHGVDHPAAGPLLFVVEQPGVIRVFGDPEDPQFRAVADPGARADVSTGDGQVFLDLSATIPAISGNSERGLLGLAFHPDYPNDPRLFVNYTDLDGHTRIEEHRQSAADPLHAEEGGARLLLFIEQPFANHNGGWLGFGPDGFLYIATGDGGSGGDPRNHGQNRQSLLGKILRIDVDASEGGRPYAIPSDNPFVDDPGASDEIWSYGWRNPWRCSFDSRTGDFWAADVGQNKYEEVDFEPAGTPGGGNYGWRLMEGLECYNPASNCDPGRATVPPIHTYGRTTGFSITGGYVYRGQEIPSLVGQYLFGDFGSARIWSLARNGAQVTVFERTHQLTPIEGTIEDVASFGEDARGEILIVERAGPSTGQIWRIVPVSSK